MTVPTDESFYMPAEWQHHTRCWMAWPEREELWGKHLEAARNAYAEVAHAIALFEPVTMIAKSKNVAEVSIRCKGKVNTLAVAHDDSWLRDNGPTFVVNPKKGVAAIRWQWNAWGNKYPGYERDALVSEAILNHLGIRWFNAPMVMEGGAIHVDGEGTLITTESCLLNPNRNPNMTKRDVEEIFKQYLGIQKVIWLAGGLQDDDTDGHVDEIACFFKPAALCMLSTPDKSDGNYHVLQENINRIKAAKDAKGREFNIVEIEQPAPQNLSDGRRMSLSYLNFYVANGAIIMPSFKDPQDHKAFEAIGKLFPDRKVLQVPAIDIFKGGGGIHCITQQQPGFMLPNPDVQIK